jgi:hypothetical protein
VIDEPEASADTNEGTAEQGFDIVNAVVRSISQSESEESRMLARVKEYNEQVASSMAQQSTI